MHNKHLTKSGTASSIEAINEPFTQSHKACSLRSLYTYSFDYYTMSTGCNQSPINQSLPLTTMGLTHEPLYRPPPLTTIGLTHEPLNRPPLTTMGLTHEPLNRPPLTTMGLTHEPINQVSPLPRWVWPRNRAGRGRSSCWPGSTGNPATSLPSPSLADGYSSRCQTGLSAAGNNPLIKHSYIKCAVTCIATYRQANSSQRLRNALLL